MFQARLSRISDVLLLVLILSWMSAGARSSLADSDQAEIDRIKQRASEYFNAVRSGQITKASEFILPRSRHTIEAPRPGKARMTNFSILGVVLEAGDCSAIVTINREITGVPLGGRMNVKRRFRWKKESGEWFLDPADPPKTKAAIFKEYYYDKFAARTNPKPGTPPLPLEVEFEKTVYDFGLAIKGDPLQPHFTFRNLSSQDIVVEKIYGPEWLIKDRTEKQLVPAGQAGEIKVELDTAPLHRRFVQDIFVQFEPIKEIVKLRIKGRVFTAQEIAESEVLSKLAASSKSDSAEGP